MKFKEYFKKLFPSREGELSPTISGEALSVTNNPHGNFVKVAWRRDLMPALDGARKLAEKTPDPFHDFTHVERVFGFAKIIFEEEFAKKKKYTVRKQKLWDVLAVACFFHDIGRQWKVPRTSLGIIWQTLWDVPLSIKSTIATLTKLGYRKKFIARVCLTIQGTNGWSLIFSNKYSYPMAKVLADADQLEVVSSARLRRGLEAVKNGVSARYIDNMINLNLKYNIANILGGLYFKTSKRIYRVIGRDLLEYIRSSEPAIAAKYGRYLTKMKVS